MTDNQRAYIHACALVDQAEPWNGSALPRLLESAESPEEARAIETAYRQSRLQVACKIEPAPVN